MPGIFLCQDSSEIPAILNSFTPEEIYERQIAGVRFVYKENTCFDRMYQVLEIMGKKVDKPQYKVAVVINNSDVETVSMFHHQTYPNKELITEKMLSKRYREYDIMEICIWKI